MILIPTSDPPSPSASSMMLLEAVRKLLVGTGAGAGAYLAYLGSRVLLAEPRMVLTIVGQWGPMVVVLLVGLWFANGRVGEWIGVMRDNTQAQQQMADALGQIADRDDRASERQQAMMNYNGQQLEKILLKLDSLGPGKCGGNGNSSETAESSAGPTLCHVCHKCSTS
jgi:hypothetical protein